MIIFKKYSMLFKSERFNLVIERMLYTTAGQLVISIFFGIALAFVFQKTCKGPKCYVFQPPALKNMYNSIYKMNGDCYKYTPYFVKCAS